MSPSALLIPIAIQLATLLAPIAAGLAGLISGALAGLLSILGWFLVGMPMSYAFVDARAARRARVGQPSRQIASGRRGDVEVVTAG